ncbi:MAG: hypothetical protein ABR501_11135 [Pyrinomonadaceae bacterium]
MDGKIQRTAIGAYKIEWKHVLQIFLSGRIHWRPPKVLRYDV